MAGSETFYRLVQQVKSKVKINLEPFLEKKKPEELNFRQINDKLKLLDAMLNIFLSVDHLLISEAQFNKIIPDLTSLSEAIDNITSFSFSEGGDKIQYDNLISIFSQRLESLVNESSLIRDIHNLSFEDRMLEEFKGKLKTLQQDSTINIIDTKKVQIEMNKARDEFYIAKEELISTKESFINLKQEFKSEFSGDLEVNKAELKKLIEELKSDSTTVLNEARKAGGNLAVADHEKAFKVAARHYSKLSGKWLCTTQGIFALTIIIIFFSNVIGFNDVKDDYEYFTQWGLKLVIYGLLTSATFWCAKNYRSFKHLEQINLHKARALKTFAAFVEASTDPQTRDAVLLETTRTIFGTPDTGFVDSKGGPERSNIIYEKILGAVNKD